MQKVTFESLPSAIGLIIDKIEKIEELLNYEKQSNLDPTRKLLNITQAAELTGIKKNTLYLYTSRNKIPHSKRANKLFFFEDDLISWIEESKRITNK